MPGRNPNFQSSTFSPYSTQAKRNKIHSKKSKEIKRETELSKPNPLQKNGFLFKVVWRKSQDHCIFRYRLSFWWSKATVKTVWSSNLNNHTGSGGKYWLQRLSIIWEFRKLNNTEIWVHWGLNPNANYILKIVSMN